MMREHFGPAAADVPLLAPRAQLNSGDGIRMAQKLGADLSGEPDGMHIEPVDPRSRARRRSCCSIPTASWWTEPVGILRRERGPRPRNLGGVRAAPAFRIAGRTAYAILDARCAPFRTGSAPRAPRCGRSRLRRRRTRQAHQGRGGELSATVAAYNAACTGNPQSFDATPATASPRPLRSRRRNRTGRAPSRSRQSSPGRSSAPSPTPSAGFRPTTAPACCAAARPFPASTPLARSPGIFMLARTRCRWLPRLRIRPDRRAGGGFFCVGWPRRQRVRATRGPMTVSALRPH